MEILPEVEVWYALPALRRALAEELQTKGLSQKEIADKLELAPSAVNQYLQGKRGASKLPKKIHKHIQEAATNLAEGAEPKQELMKLTTLLRETKAICEIHAQHAEIPTNCDYCFK
ncbi:MAG: transcriptional regulator [Candidatus Woesearchaeota archaeon]